MLVPQISHPSRGSFGGVGEGAGGLHIPAAKVGRKGVKRRGKLLPAGPQCPQGRGDLTQQSPTALRQAASAVWLTAGVSPKPLAAPALK